MKVCWKVISITADQWNPLITVLLLAFALVLVVLSSMIRQKNLADVMLVLIKLLVLLSSVLFLGEW